MDFKTDIGYRRKILTKLLDAVMRREADVIEALQLDFGKPPFESVLTETSLVISELKDTIRKIHYRARQKSVFPNLLNFPSRDYIYPEPYGKVLIIAPWNYPFLLAMTPLISAVSAGNSVVLKPSEHTPSVTAIIEIIISEVFDPVHVEVFKGGAEVAEKLLQRRWDYIFFTGSTRVGKIVAKAAAEHLTPVTLELGGKNPCIVDETANLALAAKRIAWGKFMNAGQTCIAPDYVLVKSPVKTEFIGHLKKAIKAMYGENPKHSPDFARIINDSQFRRLTGLIDTTKVVHGGSFDLETHYIAPTIIDNPAMESGIMAEEIFGPLLPILAYDSDADLQNTIGRYEKPLSLYVFTSQKRFAEKIISEYSFGGGCINDTVVHFSNKKLPFGGVGYSGVGRYHGKFGFETFSHYKGIVRKATWLDITLRYAPYEKKFSLIKKILKWF
ncbi:Aldehyde dehydrogenase [Flavobacterium longum]|uniref:aldehyde dehydrogenase n=1 Tax=Flavobacterium longum TaxID=1299340 RepID=UPI0039E8E062